MRDTIIERMLATWEVEGITDEQQCDMMIKILEQSQLVDQLKDLDYYMCDDDRLPACVVNSSKLIDDNRQELINDYQYKVTQTMRSLARVQTLLTNELLACASIEIQEDVNWKNRVKWT